MSESDKEIVRQAIVLLDEMVNDIEMIYDDASSESADQLAERQRRITQVANALEKMIGAG